MASLNLLPSLCAVPGRRRETDSPNPLSSFTGRTLVFYWQDILVHIVAFLHEIIIDCAIHLARMKRKGGVTIIQTKRMNHVKFVNVDVYALK